LAAKSKTKMRRDTCQHQAVVPRFAAVVPATKKLLSSESVTPLRRLKRTRIAGKLQRMAVNSPGQPLLKKD
jgi:hypothetical protein